MSRGQFWLTVVSANLGRGYGPGVYDANVARIMDFLDGVNHWALLLQEVDEEPDPANEHRRLAKQLPEGARKVHWHTREPIILSPSFKVVHRDRVEVMGSGLEIGGPRGTGPERNLNMCVAELRGIRLGFGDWHPHRSGLDPKVDEARDVGADIASDALTDLRDFGGGISGVYGTDYNARQMPRMVPGEKVGHHKGLDHLRYWQHPNGARVVRKARGSLPGTIDPHDPIWTRLLVTAA